MSSGHGHAHVPSRSELATMAAKPLPGSWRTISLVLAAAGFALFIFGAASGQDRAWQAFQFNWMFFWTISAAAVTFAAVQRIVTARWSRSTVRLLEAFVGMLPVLVLLLVVTLLFGLDHIFPWATTPPHVQEKALWLSKGFLIPRDLVATGGFAALACWFVYNSVRLDVAILPESGRAWARGLRERMRTGFGHERRELHTQHSLQGKIAVAMVLVFGFGSVMLSWDLSMSADVHFQSTMYGWQVMMGGWVVMLMVFSMLVRVARHHLGAHEIIGEAQYHDIGKLCFAFTAFWGYLTFSQYLVIWYGNWPEETHFFNLRLMGPWKALTLSYVVLMFIIPFFGLMGKYPKLFTPTMAFCALSSALGLWIHRYIEIYPSIYGEISHLPFGLYEVGVFVGFLGLWGFCYTSVLDAFPKIRVFMMTSEYRDEVQIPVDADTMEPLPAHE